MGWLRGKARPNRDANHYDIVRALEAVGASVHDTSGVGDGFPDIVVGYRGVTYLMEIKDPAQAKKVKHADGLRGAQVEWHRAWKGQRCIAETVREALEIVGAVRRAS